MEIFKLLEKVCVALEEKKIPYMLSGSLAMNNYTVPRMTRDIDIVIKLNQDDIEKFSQIFKEGYYIPHEGIREEIKRRGMFNIIEFDSGLKLDFIIRKDAEYHINEFKRRRKTSAFGFEVWTVSLEDLIISKLKWIQEIKSDLQIRDISNLLKNPAVDMNYIKAWCNKLNLNTFGLLNHE